MNYPLMKNNITKNDLSKVISYLKKKDPILTQSKNVKLFEENWSKWLGVKYSVFVNSGSSANLISLALLKQKYPNGGEVIIPTLTWVSDVTSVLNLGFKPVFVDILMKNLSLNTDEVLSKITNKTVAVFITHAQGFNGLSDKLLKKLKNKKIVLIEDVCESHGAVFKKKKLGTYGLISNFSFYYAHHMSTIEGGMVCTNDEAIYENARMLRGHGLLREMSNKTKMNKLMKQYPDLNPQFIFYNSGYNFRNNEINAIIGLNQLKKLNYNIKKRNQNHQNFLNKINKKKYFTNFDLLGSSNYAFNIIFLEKDLEFRLKFEKKLTENNIEFRRGSAGGGNQLRQPYLKNLFSKNYFKSFPVTEHIHSFGYYIGNYPDLNKKDINYICKIINSI